MFEQSQEYQTARQQVIRRTQKRLIFAAHFALYMAVVLMSSGRADGLYLWFPVLFVHFLYAFGIGRGWFKGAVQREMERQRHPAIYDIPEKPKRGEKAKWVSLSDDGELIDEDDADEALGAAAPAHSKGKRDD